MNCQKCGAESIEDWIWRCGSFLDCGDEFMQTETCMYGEGRRDAMLESADQISALQHQIDKLVKQLVVAEGYIEELHRDLNGSQ